MHLRSFKTFKAENVCIPPPGDKVKTLKFIDSEYPLFLDEPRIPVTLTPENYRCKDLLYASPKILQYSEESFSWGKFFGKDFMYKTPKEEDVFSIGLLFLHTMVLDQEIMKNTKNKILKLKSPKSRLAMIRSSTRDLPYESLEEMNKLISQCLAFSSLERPNFEVILCILECMLPDKQRNCDSPIVHSPDSSFDNLCDLSTDEKVPNKANFL